MWLTCGKRWKGKKLEIMKYFPKSKKLLLLSKVATNKKNNKNNSPYVIVHTTIANLFTE